MAVAVVVCSLFVIVLAPPWLSALCKQLRGHRRPQRCATVCPVPRALSVLTPRHALERRGCCGRGCDYTGSLLVIVLVLHMVHHLLLLVNKSMSPSVSLSPADLPCGAVTRRWQDDADEPASGYACLLCSAFENSLPL